MNIGDVFQNRVLILTALSGISAQTIKVILSLVLEKRLNFRRITETGGMPSSHSASVATLSTLVGLSEGFNSVIFGITAVLSLIVMYDAAGLRRAAGRQASVLNRIIDDLQLKRGIKEQYLKELLGHTPLEVIMGAAFGILFAFAFYY